MHSFNVLILYTHSYENFSQLIIIVLNQFGPIKLSSIDNILFEVFDENKYRFWTWADLQRNKFNRTESDTIELFEKSLRIFAYNSITIKEMCSMKESHFEPVMAFERESLSLLAGY